MKWLADLRALGVPVSDASDDKLAYGRDWTRIWQPNPSAVAFPRHAEEVATTLDFCRRHGVAVVPSGGRTGLAGGAVASDGELVLSLERLNQLGEVDRFGCTLEVGAGAVTQAVHEHSAGHGLTWPIDLGARGSSQIGGNLATNAGGLRVIRYGMARHWVTGMQAAFMDGSLVELGRDLHKDNAGPNLAQLLIGSEGIFAVITRAHLRLTPLPRQRQVIMLACSGFTGALELLLEARLQERLPLLAFEYFDEACMEVVTRAYSWSRPVERNSAYALLEIEGPLDERLEGWLGRILDSGQALDGVIARSESDAARLWAYRERITETLARDGIVHKNDVSLPVARMPAFVADYREEIVRRSPGRCFLFGHVGDGNLHLNICQPPQLDAAAFWGVCQDLDHDLYRLLAEHGGSVSAEHGIGLLKKTALSYSKGESGLTWMRRLKRALDPEGLLNPGKVFDR